MTVTKGTVLEVSKRSHKQNKLSCVWGCVRSTIPQFRMMSSTHYLLRGSTLLVQAKTMAFALSVSAASFESGHLVSILELMVTQVLLKFCCRLSILFSCSRLLFTADIMLAVVEILLFLSPFLSFDGVPFVFCVLFDNFSSKVIKDTEVRSSKQTKIEFLFSKGSPNRHRLKVSLVRANFVGQIINEITAY